jgi:uncharacterized protein YigA (DUF484 family)
MSMDLIEADGMISSPGRDDRETVRDALLANSEWLRNDPQLLADLGLRLDAANIVDFGPVALSRVSAAHQRESSERMRLETMARANYAAQTQTHAAVTDVLQADSLADLALRVDQLARQRFGLVMGSLALEGDGTPAGWLTLVEGQSDLLLGDGNAARMGRIPTAAGLFGMHAPQIQSVALTRLALWNPMREGVMAFGSIDSEAFTPEMGSELVTFLGRIVEHTAQRWPNP